MNTIIQESQNLQESINPQESTSSIQKPLLEFKSTTLSISTCTLITNLNSKINLGLISRFINIYEQYSPELNEKSGGLYNLEFYGNCARGETLIDKIKDEFNNQATIKFKYWGFRNVNIKIFANGRLQMTGLKDEDEAKIVSELLINVLNNITINITKDIKTLNEISKIYDFQLIYDENTNSVSYYRKYYNRFLKDYEFDTDLVYENKKSNTTQSNTSQSNTSQSNTSQSNTVSNNTITNTNSQSSFVNLNRKHFIKGVHDVYNINSDLIEKENSEFLKENEWSGDEYIRNTINKIDKIKDYFTSDLEDTLINSTTLNEVKQGVENLMKKYTDFKFPLLDKILSDISKNLFSANEHTVIDPTQNNTNNSNNNTTNNNTTNSNNNSNSNTKKRSDSKNHIFSTDEQTLINVKNEIFKFHRVYKHFLEKKINRLVTIRTIDITICEYVKQYLLKNNQYLQESQIDDKNTRLDIKLDKYIKIPIEKLELIIGNITEPYNYFVSNIETVMINSDFSINHNINLKRMSKLLKKRGLYNSYEPDEYPGVLTKYYYNIKNKYQGLCNCSPHCSTKEKHSICTKITISVFRPGSVIITGARNIDQLLSAYDFIIKILKDNIEYIKGIEYEDDNKHIALMNNEFRKISRKPRLFFIKKTNIINYPSE